MSEKCKYHTHLGFDCVVCTGHVIGLSGVAQLVANIVRLKDLCPSKTDIRKTVNQVDFWLCFADCGRRVSSES